MHYPPQILTPDFWPADEEAYRALLDRLCPGEYEAIGNSAGGREIWAVHLQPHPGAPTFGVVGGMHGHEAQGPASCFNLLSAIKTGQDLKGRRWPLPEVNWAIVFCLNPDARARMPNTFVALSVKDVLNYDAGLLADGERKSFSGDVDPADTMVLGGLFNDAGTDIIRHPDLADTVSPERNALLDFIARVQPAACLELHAHCAAPQFYCPLAPTPPDVTARQVELTSAVIAVARAEGLDFADSTGEVTGLSTALYHTVSGAVPFLFESPQGVLDAGPRWDHVQIIDINLLVITELAELCST